MDWETLLRHPELIGGELEITAFKHGYSYRGPILGVRCQDDTIIFDLQWFAWRRHKPMGDAKWRGPLERNNTANWISKKMVLVETGKRSFSFQMNQFSIGFIRLRSHPKKLLADKVLRPKNDKVRAQG